MQLKIIFLTTFIILAGCSVISEDKIFLSCEGIEKSVTHGEVGVTPVIERYEIKKTLKVEKELRELFFKRIYKTDQDKDKEGKNSKIFSIKFTGQNDMYTHVSDFNDDDLKSTLKEIVIVNEDNINIIKNEKFLKKLENNKSENIEVSYRFELDRISGVYTETKKIVKNFSKLESTTESNGVCKKVAKAI